MRSHVVLLALAMPFASSMARADIIVPERQACRDQKVGDACDGGTCQSDGFSCQAGSCRQHGDEGACRSNGCSWVEGLSCKTAPTPSPATPLAPTPAATPESPSSSSCAVVTGDTHLLAALMLLGLGLRRRRQAA
jgi:MYXO-CTERM domain-containing protein